jgi:hypothetical protein
MDDAVPEPSEDDGGGFSEASGDGNELGFAGAANSAPGEARLVVVRRITGGVFEKGDKLRGVHKKRRFRQDELNE